MGGIILDIDDTLADSSTAVASVIWQQFPLEQYDSVEDAIHKWGMPELVPEWRLPHIQDQIFKLVNDESFMSSLQPIQEAQKGVLDISKKFPVVAYVTSRLSHLQQVSEEWLRKNQFPTASVICRSPQVVALDWKLQYIEQYLQDTKAYIDNELHVPEQFVYKGRLIEILRFKKVSPIDKRVEVFENWPELIKNLI